MTRAEFRKLKKVEKELIKNIAKYGSIKGCSDKAKNLLDYLILNGTDIEVSNGFDL